MKTVENKLYAVVDANKKASVRGDFWALKLRNKEESIDAKIWHPASQIFPTITPDMVIMVYKGALTEYQGSTYIDISEGTTVDLESLSTEEVASLIPVANFDINMKFAEMKSFIGKFVKNEEWKRFALNFIDDDEIKKIFLTTIGGKSIHHAYIGGLLEHTYACMRNVVAIQNANNYKINLDLAIVGALVHDIGKGREYNSGVSFSVTREGSLLGHIVIGIEMLVRFLDKSDLSQPEKDLLKHLIVSHHGQLDYGSPKIPMSAEAELLHIVDLLDSRLNTVEIAVDKVEDIYEWTDPIRSRGYVRYMKTV